MRVLVVDDSMLFRKCVRDALKCLPDVEVVGVAADGKMALEKIEQLRPDLMTLDIEMPELNGLEVLSELKQRGSSVGTILLSALTGAGAQMTTAGLGLGAFDFVLKPAGRNAADSADLLRHDLLPKVAAFAASRTKSVTDTASSTPLVPELEDGASSAGCAAPEILVIGVSTGGPQSLTAMLPKLPADLPFPVLIVQHMPPMFTATFAADLNRLCSLQVCEATDCQRIQPGHIYIAPGGKQMRVIGHPRRPGTAAIGVPTRIRITDDEPERGCKPSINYLFRSVAELYGRRALAVIMTGMGDDGTEGCRALKRTGARVIAQSEPSCVVYGMPRSVIEAGLADATCSLELLPASITRCVTRGQLLCH